MLKFMRLLKKFSNNLHEESSLNDVLIYEIIDLLGEITELFYFKHNLVDALKSCIHMS